MFKTFAHVCILSSLALAAGIGYGQAAAQPTTGTVKNHISDGERDRLMQQAMEKARLELEKTRAETEARERLQAERAAQAKREAAAAKAAEEKKRADEAARKQADAAARKRAEEERLAAELAEAEKKSSEKARQQAADAVKDLDAEKAERPAEKTERAKATPEPKKAVPSKPESKPESESKTASKPAPAEKTVVESLPTRGQSAPITVKTTMPVGDEQRRAEQAAARRGEGTTARAADRPVAGASSSSGSTHTYTGLIVGVMRSSSGEAKVLIQQEDGLTVQAVLANATKIPAPGTLVSVRGKTVGGSDDSPVITANSLDVKSGRSVSSRVPEVMPEPEPALAPPPFMHPDPVMMGPGPMMGPPMPPLGPMGPMGGPMPMMGPMPPF